MMVYVLLIAFIILFVFAYLVQKNFIAPFSLFISSFLFAIGLIALNADNWDVNINDRFIIYVFTAILFFGLGCLLMELLFGEKKEFLYDRALLQKKAIFLTEYYPALAVAIISIICSIGFVAFMIKSVEFTTNVPVLLHRIYVSFTSGGSTSIFSTQLKEIVVGVVKISVFEIMLERFFTHRNKIKFLHIVPIISFILCTIFSTDRNIFLRFILYIMCLWILFSLDTEHVVIDAVNWKILKVICIFTMITACAFFGLGQIKNYQGSIDRMLSIYGGSGIYNFNLYLESFHGQELQYGKETFSETIKTLNALITGTNERKMPFDDAITFTSSTGYYYTSNIYSALWPYINDFGYAGVIIYPLLLGIIFELLFIQTKKHKYGFWWILYSMSMYSLVYTTILEQFFKRWHLGMIYEIGWIVLLYYAIYVFRLTDTIHWIKAYRQRRVQKAQ